MRSFHSRIRLTVTAGLCILLALLILTLPLQWILAAIIAALFHELCHMIAVILCGGRISGLRLRQSGAVMTACTMTAGREVVCALAGPAGSLLLLPFLHHLPRIAFCAAVHGIYNLLPLSHLDGGKVLRSVLRIAFPARVGIICIIVQNCCLALIWLLAIYIAIFCGLGYIPILFALSLSHAAKKGLANMA